MAHLRSGMASAPSWPMGVMWSRHPSLYILTQRRGANIANLYNSVSFDSISTRGVALPPPPPNPLRSFRICCCRSTVQRYNVIYLCKPYSLNCTPYRNKSRANLIFLKTLRCAKWTQWRNLLQHLISRQFFRVLLFDVFCPCLWIFH